MVGDLREAGRELLTALLAFAGGGGVVSLLNWYTANRRSTAETSVMVKASELDRLSCAFDTLLTQYQQLAERNDILEGRIATLETEREKLRAETRRKETELQLQLNQAYERIAALETRLRDLTDNNERLLQQMQRREEEHNHEIQRLREQLRAACGGM